MNFNRPWLPAGTLEPRRYRPGGIGNWSGHLPFAGDLVRTMRPALLVELGTHYGESYFGFCQAVAEYNVPASCYAVDTWLGESQSGFYDESVYREVNAYNAANYSSFSYLLRDTFDRAAGNFEEASIDILHLDGLHTYAAVWHDLRTWLPKVRPGGIVLLHDTMARHGDFGVWKVWQELAGEGERFEFTHSWGLGVLRKQGNETPDNVVFEALFRSDPAYQEHVRRFYELCAIQLEYQHATRKRVPPTRLTAQIYVFKNGYSDERVITAEYDSGKWHRLAIELPNGAGLGPLRIDPADRACVLDISSITLRRPFDNRVLWQANGARVLDGLTVGGDLVRLAAFESNEFCRFASADVDPQLFLPELDPVQFDQPLLLEVWLRAHTGTRAIVPVLREVDRLHATVQSPSHDQEQVGDDGPRLNYLAAELSQLRVEREELYQRAAAAQSERDSLWAEYEGLRQHAAAMQAERDSLRAEYEGLRQHASAMQAERDSLRAELARQVARAQAEREELAHQAARAQAEREELARQVARAQAERDAIAAVNKRMQTDRYLMNGAEGERRHAESERVQQELESVRQQLQEKERVLHGVLTSRSWRLTAPLRGAMAVLKPR